MDEKFVMLKRYHGMRGLSDEEIGRIASDCQVVELKRGEWLHAAGQTLKYIYFVGRGRLEHDIQDLHGNLVVRKYLTRGAQFGAVVAAQMEPAPVTVVALEPSVVLQLDYQAFLRYVAEIPRLLLNFIQDVGSAFKQTFQIDRLQNQPNVVLMVHESPKTRPLTHRLIDRLQQLGERPCLLTDDPCWESRPDIPQVLLVRNGDWMDNSAVRDQVAKWAAQERVFIDVAADIEQDRLIRGVQLADLVLPCVRIPDYKSMLGRLRQLESLEHEWRQKIALVWWLQDAEMHAPWVPELGELVSRDFKVSFDAPRPKSGKVLNHGVERIVHRLRGVCLGIALGGGAARGMAHLGVLKVLEQRGIIVDMIAGTSAGAMTGTLYASGMDVDHTVESFVKDLTPSWFFKSMRHGGYWYLLYKYRRGQFDPMLRKYLSDLRLEQLPIPVNTITVDLVSGKPLVRDSGDAVDGILESINLPGLSVPICRNGQALVDGGLVNNVPANVLVGKGCNFVIAVSVTATLEPEFANIRVDTKQKKPRSPSVMQTLMRGYLVQNVNMNSVGVQPADEIIDIDVTDFDLSEFTRTKELAAVGARTVEASMEHLRNSLSKLDGQLFAEKSHQGVTTAMAERPTEKNGLSRQT